jgi:glutathione reductase (NADPH)
VKISVAKGIDFRFNAGFEALERQDDGSILCRMKGTDDIVADEVLFAIGRLPNTEELGLEQSA